MAQPNPQDHLERLKQAASQYAALRIPVALFHGANEYGVCSCRDGLHCKSAGNHPRFKGWKDEATTDASKINGLLTRFPDSNIAVLTGARAGIVVLDFDGEEGKWTKQQLELMYGPLPRTPTVESGGGGLHMWFRHPGGEYKIPSGDGMLGPKFDLKADNAHVTVPPSRHRSGREYSWLVGLDVELAPLPEWVGPGARRAKETGESLVRSTRAGAPYRYRDIPNSERYELPSHIPEGKRSDELFRYASSLRAKGAEQHEIEDALREARDSRCADPLSVPDKELESIAKSACKYPAGQRPVRGAPRSSGHLNRASRPDKEWRKAPVFVPGIDDPAEWGMEPPANETSASTGSAAAPEPTPEPEPEPEEPGEPSSFEPMPLRRVESPMPPEPPLDLDDDGGAGGDGGHRGGGGGPGGGGPGGPGGGDEDPQLCNAGPDGFAKTELGNAERIYRSYGQDVRYVTTNKEWMVYTGSHWKVDDREQVRQWAQMTARSLHPLILQAGGEKAQKAWRGHVKAFESKSGITSAIGLMQSFPEVVRTAHDLDNGVEDYLCAPNGMVHLRTGEIMEPTREPMITRIAQAPVDMDAPCPNFQRFLFQIFEGNTDLIQFVQRAIGYSLTGHTSEQCLFFLWGQGRNGKSTLVNLIRDILGTYGTNSSFDTFLSKTNDNARADLAMLKGARMVTAGEPAQSKDFSESVIKQVTGGDKITCRKLYGQYFSYEPEFKLWLAANHKPRIKNQDEGIWRRFRMIPFTVQIPEEEKDGALPVKLRAEAPGILGWAVRGAMEWYENGLMAPDIVKDATKDYREEMDVLGDFVADAIAEKDEAEDWGDRVRDVYQGYLKWCDKNRESRPLGKKRFNQAMEEHGFRKKKRPSDGQMRWKGILLRHQYAPE